ncbi:uncharacterized protein STEHIDRAFT_122689 [Stereum hirsutum FP-91666 SS1]|uniref:uncharacterized protein n=1 Tax=Stereum hirsutum (strain FP-91666) TaxID=721885 RepID=UPI000444A17E|nr:uncharacterized protein STEHIDRAFT_122689 [Stereum hirsutum FP-91666 SS1]EIM84693.1 hypothetical protein STEHIDRAFT_122689 [Stereum hirsutum FP-91666 SS1]
MRRDLHRSIRPLTGSRTGCKYYKSCNMPYPKRKNNEKFRPYKNPLGKNWYVSNGSMMQSSEYLQAYLVLGGR